MFKSHPSALLGLLSLVHLAVSSPTPAIRARTGVNDFSCQSSSNPVVLFHGLGATYYEDINLLQDFLADKGLCTFSTTYGDYPGFPFVGGLRKISDSSKHLRDFVQEVIAKTGKDKVDLVGHSEGAFMTLYLPKAYPEIRSNVERVVALAPPSHGTTFSSLTKLGDLLSANALRDTILRLFGCEACIDLVPDGDAIKFLNNGKITQEGIKYTVLTSKHDELVTPAPAASFIEEDGVNNVLLQDICPKDIVGHLGEAYDQNVQNIIYNNLQDQPSRKFDCVYYTSFPL